MTTAAQAFYGTSTLQHATRERVLSGQVIKINPALVTLTDGLIEQVDPQTLQQQVWQQVMELLAHKIRTFHVDLNFDDYTGFGRARPQSNLAVFTPAFLERLSLLIAAHGGFLNLHLLTDFPKLHLAEWVRLPPGAVCFQLEVVKDRRQLAQLVSQIEEMGACASPVIETVGSEHLHPLPPQQVYSLLWQLLPALGMLTFQAAGTASRSNRPSGHFAGAALASYLASLPDSFTGTLQVQGGITKETTGLAVQMGAEFLVCGTQLFRNREGLSAQASIDLLLIEAANALHGGTTR
jgi:pentose-5-phosphate-3-epimerase